jgi:hypothetical protein
VAKSQLLNKRSIRWSRRSQLASRLHTWIFFGVATVVKVNFLSSQAGFLHGRPRMFLRQNAGYKVSEFIPGFFGFGSNGGGELLAFDTRGSEPWPIVMIPFIPMDVNEARQIASSFDEFVFAIGNELK